MSARIAIKRMDEFTLPVTPSPFLLSYRTFDQCSLIKHEKCSASWALKPPKTVANSLNENRC